MNDNSGINPAKVILEVHYIHIHYMYTNTHTHTIYIYIYIYITLPELTRSFQKR